MSEQEQPCCPQVGGKLSPAGLAALDADLRAGLSLRKAAAKHGLPFVAIQRHASAGHHRVPIQGDSAGGESPTNHRKSAAESATGVERKPATSPYSVTNPGDHVDTAPRKIVALDVERRCLDLRAKGTSYADIALQVGVSKPAAIDAVERALCRSRRGTDERADIARGLDLERIDKLLAALWERAEKPPEDEDGEPLYDAQDRAVDKTIKLLERHAKLLGLDAPTGVRVSIVAEARGNGDFGEVYDAMMRILDAKCPGAREQVDAGLEAMEDGKLDAWLAGDLATVLRGDAS